MTKQGQTEKPASDKKTDEIAKRSSAKERNDKLKEQAKAAEDIAEKNK
jgi:hypothetical protein